MNTLLEKLAQQQADFCRVFSNSTRIRILWALSDEELSVGTIAEAVGTSIQNVSQHLSVMRECKLLTSRREGQTIYYRVNRQALKGQCSGLLRISRPEEIFQKDHKSREKRIRKDENHG